MAETVIKTFCRLCEVNCGLEATVDDAQRAECSALDLPSMTLSVSYRSVREGALDPVVDSSSRVVICASRIC